MSLRMGTTTPDPAGNVPKDGGSFSNGSLHSPAMYYYMCFPKIETQLSRSHHPKNCHPRNYWTMSMGPVSSNQWAKLLRVISVITSYRSHVALDLSHRDRGSSYRAPAQKEAIDIASAMAMAVVTMATTTVVKGPVVARVLVVVLNQVGGDGEAREGVERMLVGQAAAVVNEHKVTTLVNQWMRTAGFGAN